MMEILKKIYKFIASMKFAIILLVVVTKIAKKAADVSFV